MDDRQPTNEDLVAAAKAAKGPERDRLLGEVIARNMGLVGMAILRLRVPPRMRQEAEQAGRIALWRSAELFDPAFGFRFSTYATRAVLNAVLRVARPKMRPEMVESQAAARHHEANVSWVDAAGAMEDRRRDMDEELAIVLSVVDPDRRKVLEAVLGVGGAPETHQAVGKRLGVSRQRVHKLFCDGLDAIISAGMAVRLREAMED